MNIRYFLSVLLLSACCGSDKESLGSSTTELAGNVIQINLDHLEEGTPPIAFDTLFREYRPVLDLSGEQLQIDNYTQSFVDDKVGHFLVYSSRRNAAMLLTLSGEKRANIEKGERTEINFGIADGVHEKVYLLSSRQGAIFRYNYSGRYLGRIPINTRNPAEKTDGLMEGMAVGRICDRIALTPSGEILVHYAWWDGNRSPFNYQVIDSLGNLVTAKKTYCPFEGHTPYRPELSAYLYRDKLHVIDLSDTLYVYDASRFIPKYIFHTRVTYEDVVDDPQKADRRLAVRSVAETDDYLFFKISAVSNKWRVKYCYLDKQNRKAYKLSVPYYTITPDSLQSSILSIQDDSVYYAPLKGAIYRFVRKND